MNVTHDSTAFIIDLVQKVINKSPLGRLGKNEQTNISCPSEDFTSLEQTTLTVCTMPLRNRRDLNSLNPYCIASVTNISVIHDALDNVYKNVAV